MKRNLTEITKQQFDAALTALQAARPREISGPFINSAPAGNMFNEPQRQSAWIIGYKTVLLKHENLQDGTAQYCADLSLVS